MNPFIISLAIRLTILLVAGGLIALAVHRSTYAVRHVVIAATLACVVALPAMMILVPEWRVGVLPAAAKPVEALISTAPVRWTAPAHPAKRSAAPSVRETIHPVLITSQLALPATSEHISAAALSSPVQSPFAPTIPQIALAIWLAGVFIGIAWITAGRFGLARVRRGATRLTTMEWRTILENEALHAGVARPVLLFTSPAVSMPVTWGVLSPVIVLPEAAHSWTHERKRVVVMHEMAHIARRDSATQLIATLACVAYWIHPLVILAARRLRAECERACDERVLERGTPAADYAAHLLDVARFSRSFGAASIVSVAMARPSQLEGRLLAVLRAKPRHSQLSRGTRVLAALTAASLLMAVSAFRPVVREVQTSKSRDAWQAPTTARASARKASSASATTAATAAQPKVTDETVTSSATAMATDFAMATATAMSTIISARTDSSTIRPTANVLSTPLRPDSVFEKSVEVHEGGTLVLDLDTGGEVDISGTDGSHVSVSGSLGGRDWRGTTVSLDASGGDARLESRYDRKSNNQSFSNKFSIHVPNHYNVRVRSAGGRISINCVNGTFTGSTGGGKIEIDHAKGEADLSTGGGSIRIANSHLDGNVSTGGGSVRFENVTGSIVPGSHDGSLREYGSMSKMPDDLEIISSSDMSDSAMEATHAAMARARAAMKIAQKTMERSAERMRQRVRVRVDGDSASAESYSEPDDNDMDDSDDNMNMSRDDMDRQHEKMEMSREKMDRFGETMERNRKMLDSTRIIIERNRGAMDSANSMLRRDMLPMAPFKFKFEKGKGDFGDFGMMQGGKNWIVIDKDGGSIHLLKAPNGAHVATGGGEIVIGSAGGIVSALTGAGRISIGRVDGAAKATTGAGDVTITTGGGEAHPVDVRSGSGNVELLLPKGANATLDLETAYTQNFGKATKIKSDWPLNVTETKEWDDSQGTPRRFVRARQKIGNGGPLIRVRTVNGDINLKQAN